MTTPKLLLPPFRVQKRSGLLVALLRARHQDLFGSQGIEYLDRKKVHPRSLFSTRTGQTNRPYNIFLKMIKSRGNHEETMLLNF